LIATTASNSPGGDVGRRPVDPGDPGAVEQDVEAPVLGLDAVAQRLERRAVGHVDGRVPIQIDDDGGRSAGPEDRGARLSDARRSAGDDGNLCVQTGDDGRMRGDALDQRERCKSG
jgi:hypothetical protein